MDLKKKKGPAVKEQAAASEQGMQCLKDTVTGHMADCEHMFPICGFKLVTCVCDRAAFVTHRINTNVCYSTAQFTLSALPEQEY